MNNAILNRVLMTFALVTGAPLATAGDVSVGVTITGEITPGVYGRVDLSNRPPPRLVYAQPMIIEPAPRAVVLAPIYMHVPPGHAKNWRKHCHEYHACDRSVYFVRSAEYESDSEHGRRKKHKHHEDE